MNPTATQTREITLTVNRQVITIQADPNSPLLFALRNDCQLNGPKYGCGLGECGACSILIDGKTARSCSIPLKAAIGRQITTLEGLSQNGQLHPVQQAFVDAQGAQCGYCLNGMIITTTAWLDHLTERPSEADIRNALKANLCRCGTHLEILDAVRLAVANKFPEADSAATRQPQTNQPQQDQTSTNPLEENSPWNRF
ncbi:(2Fe-2S)-binding protein [Oceanobacter mangrovi]|uniref:(2Fe-2S)-binding protein n=1 Tax=Oceanobacter mangrovi TaxID=2862510 RepID=UPI001C8EA296|nr:(2Fe-2S)-binding protein [Oceanobacter mangrovi]